jgi:hypothetical protein
MVTEGEEWSPVAVNHGLAGATPVGHPKIHGKMDQCRM